MLSAAPGQDVMIRLWPKRRKHEPSVSPEQAQQRLLHAAVQAGEATEAHAQQKRARKSEAPLLQSMDDILAGNAIGRKLRNAILHADDT